MGLLIGVTNGPSESGTDVQKLRSVQVLRGIAVLAVVVFHYTDLRVGRAGVDLFFCISGFVMAGQMTRTPAQFAWDRFTRIYPPFLAAMALLFLVHPMVPDAGRLVNSFLLLPDYHAIYLYPAWSLGYEAIFYAACVLSMFAGGRAVLIGYAVLFVLHVPYAGSAFPLEFLAGFAIARKAWWALPILLVAATRDTRVLTYGAPAALFLWWSVRNESAFERLVPLALVGDASYSIYLTHTLSGAWVPGMLAIPFAVAFGSAFHFTVEKPLTQLARLKRKPALVAEVGQDLRAFARGQALRH